MLKIRDLLQLDTLKKSTIEAGEKGLDNLVTSAGIVDYEFTDALENSNNAFEKDSIVLSSLLFAKENPKILTDAVLELINQGVSGLAYKSVIFNKLPDDVIKIANRLDFPIIRFEHNQAFMEDVIYEIMGECKKDSNMELFEDTIKKFVEKDINEKDAKSIILNLKPNFSNSIKCFCIKMKSSNKIKHYFSKYNPSTRLKNKSVIGIYKNELILVLSSAKENYNILLEDFFISCSLDKRDCIIGSSSNNGKLDNTIELIEESRIANKIGEVINNSNISYDRLGSYIIIYKMLYTIESKKYQKKYLYPIFENESDDNKIEMYNTLKSYVLNGGNLSITSKEMNCHQNTIRYRIKKFEEILGFDGRSFEFFEASSIALKLHLLENKISLDN